MLNRWANVATILGLLLAILTFFKFNPSSSELRISVDDVKVNENKISVSISLVNKSESDEVVNFVELAHISGKYPISFRYDEGNNDFPMIIRSNEVKKLVLEAELKKISLQKEPVSFLISIEIGSLSGIKQFNFGCLDREDEEFHFSLMVFDIYDYDGGIQTSCSTGNYSSYYKL
ncbi:hypothetical protein L1D24_05270 [Vibrio brasiliensis]|uniref:hypothetical protein n=1 Tax=Vibrio brasiliensis TaxID=170652 RepID=UPI001EFD893E|nr:hypothetical protein [Vibrio brasiliensis]MCG9647980.1 hypothetical protein [Vibrio brasiliensis]